MTASVGLQPQSRPLNPAKRQRRGSPREYYAKIHCLLLCGYACLGRAFAYIGIGPIYVGEIVLAMGLLYFLTAPKLPNLMSRQAVAPPLIYMAIGCLSTAPYLGQYGLMALRDAVLWIYAAFAFIVWSLLYQRNDRLRRLQKLYRRFAKFYLLFLPSIWAVTNFLPTLLPLTPAGDVATVRAEEALIHLSAITMFLMRGQLGRSLLWPVMLTIDLGLYITINRGALIGYICVLLLACLTSPSAKHAVTLFSAILVGALLMSQLGVYIPLSRRGRPLSLDQLKTNIVSIFDSRADTGDLQGTKLWRLAWWHTIVGYTVFGEYFWTGKGYGINLADDDGFQVDPVTGSLRSPHNGHLCILARSGVPGLLSWLGLNAWWVIKLTQRYLSAKRVRHQAIASLCLLLLAYWLSTIVTMSFTVMLEAPMIGIWYWSVIGVGLTLISSSRRKATPSKIGPGLFRVIHFDPQPALPGHAHH